MKRIRPVKLYTLFENNKARKHWVRGMKELAAKGKLWRGRPDLTDAEYQYADWVPPQRESEPGLEGSGPNRDAGQRASDAAEERRLRLKRLTTKKKKDAEAAAQSAESATLPKPKRAKRENFRRERSNGIERSNET